VPNLGGGAEPELWLFLECGGRFGTRCRRGKRGLALSEDPLATVSRRPVKGALTAERAYDSVFKDRGSRPKAAKIQGEGTLVTSDEVVKDRSGEGAHEGQCSLHYRRALRARPRRQLYYFEIAQIMLRAMAFDEEPPRLADGRRTLVTGGHVSTTFWARPRIGH
jgi:hypothetical protein